MQTQWVAANALSMCTKAVGDGALAQVHVLKGSHFSGFINGSMRPCSPNRDDGEEALGNERLQGVY
jgi:hypothetical protein